MHCYRYTKLSFLNIILKFKSQPQITQHIKQAKFNLLQGNLFQTFMPWFLPSDREQIFKFEIFRLVFRPIRLLPILSSSPKFVSIHHYIMHGSDHEKKAEY